ncbi:SigE family RNA polymerase sigma factor [Nocardioides dongkuii]|uniref:SigE family RNA polymerase sigma factor n=1 Tax=Nocardioides dongkuii TaxID=2760089 RepID=UPI001C7087E6|nr:SigE family RNA polymerase sigma factor [Nocardioides dongkuii]
MSTPEFVDFYAAQKDRCLRAAVASGMAPDRAEDAVAEAFARAWSRWRVVGAMDSPAAWVVRTAINQNTSWWRTRRREVVTDAAPDLPVTDELGRVDLVAAIRRLPPRQREVVVLRYLLDLDTRSTARSMGVSPGTVSAHLHHALASLREHLTISEGTPS